MKKNEFKLKILWIFFIIVSTFTIHFSLNSNCFGAKKSLINFSHLEHLSEIIMFQGDSVGIVHIYSEYPDYQLVDAGVEGIACVDDVARAALLRLRFFELTGDLNSLKWARFYLKFVLKMQTEDGEYYNFIDSDYKINKTGKTSFNSFGWWAVRGYWALGEGYRIFQNIDKQFAQTLHESFLRCKNQIKAVLKNYPKTEMVKKRSYPKWLMSFYAADQTAVLIQALTSYLRVEADSEIEQMAGQFAEGIIKMQLGENADYPSVFLSYPDLWHAWGNCQAIALNKLGKQTSDPAIYSPARREVSQFYPWILLNGGLNLFYPTSGKKLQFPQIAYGIRCFALGALSSYEAGADSSFAQLAGLLASWFFANNSAKKNMYDPKTGRGYDGIINENKINKNAGAESTIEALAALLEIENNSVALPFLSAQQVGKKEQIILKNFGKSEYKIYELADKSRYTFVYSTELQQFKILPRKDWQNFIKQK